MKTNKTSIKSSSLQNASVGAKKTEKKKQEGRLKNIRESSNFDLECFLFPFGYLEIHSPSLYRML